MPFHTYRLRKFESAEFYHSALANDYDEQLRNFYKLLTFGDQYNQSHKWFEKTIKEFFANSSSNSLFFGSNDDGDAWNTLLRKCTMLTTDDDNGDMPGDMIHTDIQDMLIEIVSRLELDWIQVPCVQKTMEEFKKKLTQYGDVLRKKIEEKKKQITRKRNNEKMRGKYTNNN
tara:strand:+ start:2057 stop:2572 length:516 start_codon:yes stop_codon:yes gene_type:complete